MPMHLRILLFVWAFVAMSTNLKVEFVPSIDWILMGLLLPCLCQHCLPRLSPLQLVLLAVILLAGIASDKSFVSFVWAAKLGTIFLCTYCLVHLPWPPTAAFAGFIASLVANTLLIIAGSLGFGGVFEQVGAFGRSATILNYPGSLWRVGLICLFYFAFLGCRSASYRLISFIGVSACILVVMVDGSRTGMLVLCAAPIILAYMFMKERFVIVFVATLMVMLAIPAVLDRIQSADDGPLARMSAIFESSGSFQDRLMDWSPDRYEMIQRSIEMICERPLLGNGIQAAAVEYRSESGEVVDVVAHNGYLQIWADAGLIGFICYVGILWDWLRYLPGIRTSLRKSDIHRQALAYNAVFLLTVFDFTLFAHPVSVEWSEWVAYSVPYALLAQAVRQNRSARQEMVLHVKSPVFT
jgi:O-antigen ligase